jgi:hypothetical protein
MREISLGFLYFIIFNQRIVLSIDERWSKFFDSEHVFEAKIDKSGRLILCGPHVKGFPQKSVMTYEDSNDG